MMMRPYNRLLRSRYLKHKRLRTVSFSYFYYYHFFYIYIIAILIIITIIVTVIIIIIIQVDGLFYCAPFRYAKTHVWDKVYFCIGLSSPTRGRKPTSSPSTSSRTRSSQTRAKEGRSLLKVNPILFFFLFTRIKRSSS